MELLSFFFCKYLSDPDCLLHGGLGGGGVLENREPLPGLPAAGTRPAPEGQGRFTGATSGFLTDGGWSENREPALGETSPTGPFHFTLSSFRPCCFSSLAAQRPKRDRSFVLALEGRDWSVCSGG